MTAGRKTKREGCNRGAAQLHPPSQKCQFLDNFHPADSFFAVMSFL